MQARVSGESITNEELVQRVQKEKHDARQLYTSVCYRCVGQRLSSLFGHAAAVPKRIGWALSRVLSSPRLPCQR